MRSFLRKKLINTATRHLFKHLTSDDILRVNDQNGIMYKGKPLSREQLAMLSRDAQTFRNSTLWQILSDEMKFHANKRIFENSNTMEDTISGKMLLYYINLAEEKLEKLSNL